MKLWNPCLILLALLGASAPAGAAEWFVAPGGNGPGTAASPFARIQDGLNAAQPGDTVTVLPGTYAEALRSVRSGTEAQPIRLRAQGPRGSVVITVRGTVLRVDHAYFIAEGLVFDGQYGMTDALDINSPAHFFTLRDSEVRRSSRDLIDIGSPRGVLIEGCLIHHALNAAGGRTDAHGVVASAAVDLTIRDTEIHTFSGDGFQIDPGRLSPGWDRVTLERTRIWLAPLPDAENGFPAGTVAGENAVDTKVNPAMPRPMLIIRDTTAWGFRGGLIGNMAAFNLKEKIDAVVDRVTVHGSEIAFRLRGGGASMNGARVAISNAVIYDTTTAFRYEDNIQNLRIWNSTVGARVRRAFQPAASGTATLEVRNLLVLGSLPSEAAHPSNRSVDVSAFVDVAVDNYALAAGSPAVDAGVEIPAVTTDRLGTPRPQGRGVDIGAFETTAPTSAAHPSEGRRSTRAGL